MIFIKTDQKNNGKICLQTHCKHESVKEHKDNNDKKYDNRKNDKYDVNEDKNVVIHNFIVLHDT